MGERLLTVNDLTRMLAAHLDGASVVGMTQQPIGTGQMSESRRLTLEYSRPCGLPTTMVAKYESSSEASRAASKATRTYEVETSFYREVRHLVAVNAPQCYFTEFDPATDDFALLLSDFSPCTQGDQLAGCSVADARDAVREIAGLHGPLWEDERIKQMPWLHRNSSDNPLDVGALYGMLYPGFAARYAGRLSAEALATGEQLARAPRDYFSYEPTRFSVIHGDYRLDNVLYLSSPAGSSRVGVVDFQTAAVGCPLLDVVYFVGAGLVAEDRRRVEESIVADYVDRLSEFSVALSLDEAWSLYRRYAFGGFVMAVIASMIVQQTDRGDEMFMAMANRHAQQVVDLDSFSALAD